MVRHSTWIPPDIWISYFALGINITKYRSAIGHPSFLKEGTPALIITKHRQAGKKEFGLLIYSYL
jgi:hypothetical protein